MRRLGVCGHEVAEDGEEAFGFGDVISVQGRADVLADHLLHLLRAAVVVHQPFDLGHRHGFGHMRVIRDQRDLRAVQNAHVLHVMQHDHRSSPPPGNAPGPVSLTPDDTTPERHGRLIPVKARPGQVVLIRSHGEKRRPVMLALTLTLHIFLGSSLAGTAIVIALLLGFEAALPLALAALAGFVVATPVSWTVAKALSA